MENTKQIMSPVTLTHDTKKVTIDGVDFWTKFYEECTLFLNETVRDESVKEHRKGGEEAIKIISEDFETKMLADAKAFLENTVETGEIEIGKLKVEAKSLYLKAVAKLALTMQLLIKCGIKADYNADGLSAIVTCMIGAASHYLGKEIYFDTI